MPDPAGPPYAGDALLEAVTASMVGFHERYHHREPARAHTELLEGELLACVLGEVYTDVEKTLIELQRSTIVQETRSTFQEAMRDRLITEVERLSGRRVTLFLSQSHVGPDLEMELFLLAPAA